MIRPAIRICKLAIPNVSLQVVRHLHIAFFGSDEISLTTLRMLQESRAGLGQHANLISNLTVVCPSDRPAGRGKHTTSLPVKQFATDHEIPTVEVPYGVYGT